MSNLLETIEVVNPGKPGETIVINKVDFDESVHKLPKKGNGSSGNSGAQGGSEEKP